MSAKNQRSDDRSPQSQPIDSLLYPEHPLEGRIRRALGMVPDGTVDLLDGGCSYGYGTRFFRTKAANVKGIDIDRAAIEVAKARYPDIEFFHSTLDKTPFESDSFDCITLLDCLEHVEDELAVLNEMNRLLRADGSLIVSTPHHGAFGWLDPYNYGFNLRNRFPKVYQSLYATIYKLKHGSPPTEVNPEHLIRHKHYTISDFRKMLDSSEFRGKYTIDKVFRTGLVLEAMGYAAEAMSRLVAGRRIGFVLARPAVISSKIEYWIPFGPLAYNIMIRIRKHD